MHLVKTRRQDIFRLRFAPDSRGLLAVGRYEAVLWRDVLSEARPLRYAATNVWDAGLDATGCRIIASTSAGVVVYEVGSAEKVEVVGEDDRGYAVSPSPTEPVFVLHKRSAPMSCWLMGPGGEVTRSWSQAWEHTTSEPAFYDDGSSFVQMEFRGWGTGTDPHWIVARRAATGEVLHSTPVTEFAWGGIVASPDGELIAYHVGDALVVRNLEHRTPLVRRLGSTTLKHFTAATFHPSGRFLAATSNDATVKLYDTVNWAVAKTFTWNVGRLRSVAFSPDGTLAAAGSDTGRIVVWDVDL